MASTPILPLAVWQSGTNQNSIPANDNALRIEALNREIISQAITAQPASPTDGDTYIIAATHTGAQWSTFTPGDIAIFKSGTWYAWAPTEGLLVNVAGSLFKYDGSAWVAAGGGGGGGAVDSVNGQTGTVVLDTGDIAENGNLYLTTERVQDIVGSFVVAGTGMTITYDDTANTLTFASSGGGGGGLVNITESISTTSPNSSMNVVALTVTGGIDPSGFALVPRGLGSLTAAVPDGTAAGGNARGSRAVDWQMGRSSAFQVAGSPYSVICGGYSNQIVTSSSYSVVTGGFENAISGAYNFIGAGTGNTIDGGSKSAIISGENNTISGSLYNLIHGFSNIISASVQSSTVIGRQSTSSGSNQLVTGLEAKARFTYGMRAHAMGAFNARGDAQYERYVLGQLSNSATPVVLTAGFGGVDSNGIPTLISASSMAFTGTVIARNPSGGDSASWKISGMLKNVAGTVSVVGTPSVTSIASDSSLASASVAVSADNTVGGLLVTATGLASTNLRWVATIEACFVS